MSNTENRDPKQSHLAPHLSLAPVYSPLDVALGIQAYRRGDMILYTIRGEPSEVLELIGELDKRGVGEVVALVSHQASDPDASEPPSDAESGADESRHGPRSDSAPNQL